MRNELYKKIADKYVKIYEEISSKTDGFSNFRDIAANLINVLNAISYNAIFLPSYKPKKEYHKTFITTLKATKNYFRLLKKFPEFREKEFASNEGYFPEYWHLSDRDKSHVDFVNFARERLENIVQSRM